jgi:hypothetical protein
LDDVASALKADGMRARILLSGVGLLLVVTWIRSYSSWHSFSFAQLTVATFQGRAWLGWNRNTGMEPRYESSTSSVESPDDVEMGPLIAGGFRHAGYGPYLSFLGFRCRYRTGDLIIALPYWMIISFPVLSYALMITVTYRRAALRRRQNLCVNCGYDLRGQVDRCPECGVKVTRSNDF